MTLELSVVIPAYNEASAIGDVLRAWSHVLVRLGIDHEIRVYDDGSTDATGDVLSKAAATLPRIVVATHPNRGHGPTVLRGYREASGDWVFQTDGDGEGSPDDFATLWNARHGYDVLVGRRTHRRVPLPRRCLTVGCRLAVRFLFGASIRDANSPYRLMRRSCLVEMLADVPEATFAPNAVLSGLAARRGLRIGEMPVRWERRRAGPGSIVGWRVGKAALRALRDAFAVARAVGARTNRERPGRGPR
jgi:glycosyltransferase involved in cell wall biosynthesis